MDDKVPSFADFVRDKDGEYSKAQFMSLAAKLIGEGRRPDRVYLAMFRAAESSSIGYSLEAHYHFLRDVEKDLLVWKKAFEEEIAASFRRMAGDKD